MVKNIIIDVREESELKEKHLETVEENRKIHNIIKNIKFIILQKYLKR